MCQCLKTIPFLHKMSVFVSLDVNIIYYILYIIDISLDIVMCTYASYVCSQKYTKNILKSTIFYESSFR